jgi:hypothetical protein
MDATKYRDAITPKDNYTVYKDMSQTLKDNRPAVAALV